MIKFLKRGVLGLIALYICAVSALYFFQEKLIFLPTKLPQDHVYSFDHPFEELFVDAEDGARLNALHFKAEASKGLVLYFHGNSGDLNRWGNIASFFLQYDYDVLVIDYRTYGKSTGTLSEQALYRDAQLFYDLALEGYDESNITVYGRSLGCTFAAHVAAQNEPGRLILETPFYGMEDLVKDRYPILPVKWMLKYKFPSYSFVPEISAPVHIFHGTEDAVVPYDSGRRLFERFPDGQAQLITIPDGAHNNLIDFPAYRNHIDQIFGRDRLAHPASGH